MGRFQNCLPRNSFYDGLLDLTGRFDLGEVVSQGFNLGYSVLGETNEYKKRRQLFPSHLR